MSHQESYMNEWWVHTGEDVIRSHRSIRSKSVYTQILLDMYRLIDNEASAKEAIDYIGCRLVSNERRWKDVGWLFTQAGLALPYTELAKRMARRGCVPTNPQGNFRRMNFNVKRGCVVSSTTFELLSSGSMERVGRVVMHVSVGWDGEGNVGDMQVIVSPQL